MQDGMARGHGALAMPDINKRISMTDDNAERPVVYDRHSDYQSTILTI
jgi:hypothetical protein